MPSFGSMGGENIMQRHGFDQQYGMRLTGSLSLSADSFQPGYLGSYPGEMGPGQ